MTVIKNANTPIYNQPPVIVENVPNNVRRVNFKAENDSFVKQKTPVYTQPPMLDQQAAMRKAIEDQKKAQKNAKRKQNLITALTLAGTAVMLIYFGRALLKDIRLDRLAKEAAENGDPSGAMREVGVKTKQDLLELFQDVSKEKSFEDIKMSGTLKKQLEAIMDKIQNPAKYEEAMQELEQMYIFWGPPGTGKTTFVNAMCKKFGIKPFKYDMGILKGGYQGTTENNMTKVSKVFLEEHRAQRAKNPNHISIMFFDECDEVFLEATGPNRNANNEIMSRFKQYLNEWREEPGVMVFCCTNKHPDELNEAIRDRGARVFIENPVWEALSENFFAHFAPAKEGKICENLRKSTKKSDKFFQIIQANDYRNFAYRDLQRIGWKSTEEIPAHTLGLDDIIERALKADLNLSTAEKDALSELLTLTDDLLPKAV